MPALRLFGLCAALLVSLALAATPRYGQAAAARDPLPEHAASATANVTLTPIGRPSWTPFDLHLFAAPVGTTSFAKSPSIVVALLAAKVSRIKPQML